MIAPPTQGVRQNRRLANSRQLGRRGQISLRAEQIVMPPCYADSHGRRALEIDPVVVTSEVSLWTAKEWRISWDPWPPGDLDSA